MLTDAYAPGHALHLIQRGACRRACFFGEADRFAYGALLAQCAGEALCAVHAYVLMGNHVHLLATPSGPGGATRLMRSLAERYAPQARDCEGPLWERDFETWAVFPRRYLLACMRYIELNPVRAALAARASDYRWSSFRANALGAHDPVVTPHPFYLTLGRTGPSRRAAYRALFGSPSGNFQALAR